MKNGKLHTTIHQRTVDTQHMQHLNRMKNMQLSISLLKSKLNDLNQSIADLEHELRITERENRDEIVNQLVALKDDKIDLEMQIAKTNDNNELSYFENNATILYNYYDLVENGNIQHCFTQTDDSNDIMSYFTKSQHNSPKPTSPTSPAADSRGNLLEKYMLQTDSSFIKPVKQATSTNEQRCDHCHSKDVTVMLNDGYQFCNDCYTIEYIIADHDKPSYRDPPKEISYFAYKRINHYAEFFDVVGRLWVLIKFFKLY